MRDTSVKESDGADFVLGCRLCCVQLEQYFPEPADVAPIRTLLQAAALTHNSSSTSGSSDSSLDSEAWVAVYASPYATYCVDILGAWMPEALLDGFVAMHKVTKCLID